MNGLLIDLDGMSDQDADTWLARLWTANPDTVDAITDVTLIASPLAGPVRILREVVAALAPKPDAICDLTICGHLCDQEGDHFIREYERESLYGSEASTMECDCEHHE